MPEEAKAQWRQFRATRDPQLRDTLICHHIGLVRAVAGRLAFRLPHHVSRDDLEAAGIPGLLAAIESYDPEREVDFAAYAQARIRGAILDELRELDPLPRSLRDKSRRIDAGIALLQQRLRRLPTDEEVATLLGLALETYQQILLELRGGLHVEFGASREAGEESEDGQAGVLQLSETRTPSPWNSLALKERQAILAEVLEDLPANERMVLSLYYYEELTMKEIGSVLEVTISRVSQIHRAALQRIRARLRSRRLQSDDLAIERHPPTDQQKGLHILL
jgi:RNA polymerase sigma factor for flagellar operon FliA